MMFYAQLKIKFCVNDHRNHLLRLSQCKDLRFVLQPMNYCYNFLKEYSPETIPGEWVPMPHDLSGKEVRVHLVTLQPESEKYKKVESSFRATMSGGTLSTIEQVQNRSLYVQYITFKNQMDERNPSGHKNEQWLFHGTSSDTCNKINTQGFNRSFMGKHGW